MFLEVLNSLQLKNWSQENQKSGPIIDFLNFNLQSCKNGVNDFFHVVTYISSDQQKKILFSSFTAPSHNNAVWYESENNLLKINIGLHTN